MYSCHLLSFFAMGSHSFKIACLFDRPSGSIFAMALAKLLLQDSWGGPAYLGWLPCIEEESRVAIFRRSGYFTNVACDSSDYEGIHIWDVTEEELYSFIGDLFTLDMGPADLEDASQGAMMKASEFFWRGSSIHSPGGVR